jgi:hypothetical protein
MEQLGLPARCCLKCGMAFDISYLASRSKALCKGEPMLILATLLMVILAAAGKALLLTWLTGGGIGAFILFFIVFKMFGK